MSHQPFTCYQFHPFLHLIRYFNYCHRDHLLSLNLGFVILGELQYLLTLMKFHEFLWHLFLYSRFAFQTVLVILGFRLENIFLCIFLFFFLFKFHLFAIRFIFVFIPPTRPNTSPGTFSNITKLGEGFEAFIRDEKNIVFAGSEYSQ